MLTPPNAASPATAPSPYAPNATHPTRVLLTPGLGWDSSPVGPERAYGPVGGTSTNAFGVGQELLVADKAETVPCPEHLSGEQAAALPLTGLTGWRALVAKSGAAEAGMNILVTGIGGGVALAVLGFAVAMGVRVWVTSGDGDKIERAKALGAQGGVSYKSKAWDKELKGMLPADRPYLDAVIDGAGGDVVDRVVRLLKARITSYLSSSWDDFGVGTILLTDGCQCRWVA